jgi:hypothetical protein
LDLRPLTDILYDPELEMLTEAPLCMGTLIWDSRSGKEDEDDGVEYCLTRASAVRLRNHRVRHH